MGQRLDPSDIGDVRLVGSLLLAQRADFGLLDGKFQIPEFSDG